MPENKGHAQIAARLTRAKGFVLDMDGTLVLGDKRQQGAQCPAGRGGLRRHLKTRGIPFQLFTNGTVRPPSAYVEELKHAGIDVPAERIMTPATVAAQYFLAKKYKRILVLGGEGVGGPLADAGLEIVRPPERENIDAVFAGWFHEFGMAGHRSGLRGGVERRQTVRGVAGALFRFGERAQPGDLLRHRRRHRQDHRPRGRGRSASRRRRRCARRPSGWGVAAKDICVIGDDPHLETLMAARHGALAIGVTTGVAQVPAFMAVAKPRRAHHVAENIREVLKVWRAHSG